MKISNKHYREFLDEGVIEIVTPEHLEQALKNIPVKNRRMARALLITLYYTGARPNEVLRLQAKDIKKQAHYISIFLRPSKGGLGRTLEFKYSNPHMKELWEWRALLMDALYVFYHFRSNSRQRRVSKSGTVKIAPNVSDKLGYHLKKWFTGVLDDPVPPYYLRHSRFSQLIMTGKVGEEEIRIMKGAKSMDSVQPYIHMSKARLRKISRYIE